MRATIATKLPRRGDDDIKEIQMKHWATIIGATVVATLAVPSLAAAQNAYSTADVNMRAGPAADFPIVTTIPEDRAVTIHGCVGGYEWCDVSWRNRRGWVYSEYLDYSQGNQRVTVIDNANNLGIPLISFSFGTYWGQHYPDEPWYSDRSRWRTVWRDTDHYQQYRSRTRRGYDDDRRYSRDGRYGRDRNESRYNERWRRDDERRNRESRYRDRGRDRDGRFTDRDDGRREGRRADDRPDWRDRNEGRRNSDRGRMGRDDGRDDSRNNRADNDRRSGRGNDDRGQRQGARGNNRDNAGAGNTGSESRSQRSNSAQGQSGDNAPGMNPTASDSGGRSTTGSGNRNMGSEMPSGTGSPGASQQQRGSKE